MFSVLKSQSQWQEEIRDQNLTSPFYTTLFLYCAEQLLLKIALNIMQ